MKKSVEIVITALLTVVMTGSLIFFELAPVPVFAASSETAVSYDCANTKTGVLTATAATPAATPPTAATPALTAEPTPTPTPTADPTVVSTNGIDGWPKGLNVNSETAILMDADTGAILYNKSSDQQMYPASITKILTCLVALQNGTLADQVTMTQTGVQYVVTGSSNLDTKVGEVFTLEQMLYGMMLKSANDMATQVGEFIGGGSLDQFVQMMNDEASKIGCTKTHFTNACGMPDQNHVTSAYDIALICREALKNTEFRTIVHTSDYTIPVTNLTATVRTFTNHTPLLTNPDYLYDGIIGGKTGYTDAAQNTLVTFAERDGMTLIAVAMKASDGSLVAKDNVDLLNYGYDNFKHVTVGDKNLLTEGGILTIPKDKNLSDCKMDEQKSDASGTQTVTYTYTLNGQTVGSLVMSSDKEAEYKASIKKAEEESKKAMKASSKTGTSSKSSSISEDISSKTSSTAESSKDTGSGSSSLFTSGGARIIVMVLFILILAGIIMIITLVVRRKRGRHHH